MNMQRTYHEDEPNEIELESEKGYMEEPEDKNLPTSNLEEEIASEEEDSEYLREKERQEQTRRMIEQAKQKRQKCIDDSSSSSDLHSPVNYNEPIQVEEGDDQEDIDFQVINEVDDATDEK